MDDHLFSFSFSFGQTFFCGSLRASCGVEAVWETRKSGDLVGRLWLVAEWLGREKEEVEYLMDRYLNWV